MLSFLLTFIDDESDLEFFKHLIDTYENQMHYCANKILNDTYLAEDATQNAFVNIAKNIKTVRKLNSLCVGPYLYTAAKNAAIDLIKQSKREIPVDNISNIVDVFRISETDMFDEQDFICHVLKSLPQKYRDILYYRYILGFSDKEIGISLNMNINTVRQNMFRGRKMFAEYYKREMKELEKINLQ